MQTELFDSQREYRGVTLTPSGHRPLYLIAAEIKADWKKPYFGAVPYLDTLAQLVDITDPYFADDARTMVIYFLANANTWRGPVARVTKAELKKIAGIK
jgi:hypothetical protein